MIDLERDGDVFVLTMREVENRFNADFVKAFHGALDEVEAAGSPAALVTTGVGHIYSNGLDLDWMGGLARETLGPFIQSVLELNGRVLTLPVVTVAALNGHAFGAGGQLAIAHDYRVMRSGRGYWCMPEIDMRAPLHPGMTALIQARLPIATAHESIVTGRRYAAEDAVACGIVDEAAAEADVLPRAREIAAGLAAKAHPVMQRLKRDLYPDVFEEMGRDLEA